MSIVQRREVSSIAGTRGREPAVRERNSGGCDTFEGATRERRDGTTGTRARAGAGSDQGRRERAAGALQQPGDDPPHRRGVHTELYLHLSERHAGEAAVEL